MGFFGTYLFEAGRWSEGGDVRQADEPWLFINIYDSDIATVMYRPAGSGTGMAFLGMTPRSYFDDANASAPTDPDLEARGLAEWWAAQNPATPTLADKQRELRAYLTPDTEPYDDVADRLDLDTDASVELVAGRFLIALGLTLPADLGGQR